MKKLLITLTNFIEMIKSGANNLHNNYEYINSLNIFPVPDGDTGTNMSLTMKSGVEAITRIINKSFNSVSKQFTHGLLMGARGNSGVILSQFFRGFCEVIKMVETEGIALLDLVEAFKEGQKMAYASVMKPIEGTILTITRIINEVILELNLDDYDIISFFKKIVEVANEAVEKTIEMLDVLKEANMIDSGAKGLALILEGFLHALEDNPVALQLHEAAKHKENGYIAPVEEYGFCIEMLIKLTNDIKESEIRKTLFNLGGESIVVVKSEDVVKLHVHLPTPLQVFEYGMELGELIKSKAENMTLQTVHRNDKKEEKDILKQIAVVTIGSGDGIISELYECGADAVFDATKGAPTVDDLLKLSTSVSAKTVLIIPNDKNYLLTAELVKKQSNKVRVRVVESKSIASGLAALTVFNQEQTLKTNSKEMKKAIKQTKTLELTTAAKDTTMNGIEIKKGDVILMENGRLIKTGNSEVELVREYIDKDKKRSLVEHINIMFGQNFNPSNQGEIIKEMEKFKFAEKKFINGGHPLLSLIIGFE